MEPPNHSQEDPTPHTRFIYIQNVAEHLDLNPSEVFELMHQSANWFIQNACLPITYVPPAWALGPLSHRLAAATLPHY